MHEKRVKDAGIQAAWRIGEQNWQTGFRPPSSLFDYGQLLKVHDKRQRNMQATYKKLYPVLQQQKQRSKHISDPRPASTLPKESSAKTLGKPAVVLPSISTTPSDPIFQNFKQRAENARNIAEALFTQQLTPALQEAFVLARPCNDSHIQYARPPEPQPSNAAAAPERHASTGEADDNKQLEFYVTQDHLAGEIRDAPVVMHIPSDSVQMPSVGCLMVVAGNAPSLDAPTMPAVSQVACEQSPPPNKLLEARDQSGVSRDGVGAPQRVTIQTAGNGREGSVTDAVDEVRDVMPVEEKAQGALANVPKEHMSIEECSELFKLYDTDMSGILTVTQLHEAFGGTDMFMPEIKEFFRLVDAEHKTSVTHDEFLQALQLARSPKHQSRTNASSHREHYSMLQTGRQKRNRYLLSAGTSGVIHRGSRSAAGRPPNHVSPQRIQ